MFCILCLSLLPPAIFAGDRPPFQTPPLAQGVLLIAGENLQDPNFERTVILITAYNDFGTSGLVINRRTKIPGPDVMPKLWQILPLLDHLYIGGPIRSTSISILVKSAFPVANASPVTDEIYLIDTFEQFNHLPLQQLESSSIRVYTGYAGWAPGQLESELVRGDWHLWHADTALIFNPGPENLWDKLIQMASARWASR